jgi:hypothetical protein
MVAKDIAARWEWPLRRFAWLEVAWGVGARKSVVGTELRVRRSSHAATMIAA